MSPQHTSGSSKITILRPGSHRIPACRCEWLSGPYYPCASVRSTGQYSTLIRGKDYAMRGQMGNAY